MVTVPEPALSVGIRRCSGSTCRPLTGKDQHCEGQENRHEEVGNKQVTVKVKIKDEKTKNSKFTQVSPAYINSVKKVA